MRVSQYSTTLELECDGPGNPGFSAEFQFDIEYGEIVWWTDGATLLKMDPETEENSEQEISAEEFSAFVKARNLEDWIVDELRESMD